jgi:hypothetical protein
MKTKNYVPFNWSAVLLLLPLFQGPVSSVDSMFNWWFGYGPNATGGIALINLGGWSLFLLFAVGANVYIFVDSYNREINALAWRVIAFLTMLLILPTVYFRFSDTETQKELLTLLETFFFFGVIGGIVPVSAAVGYAINYWNYEPEKPAFSRDPIYSNRGSEEVTQHKPIPQPPQPKQDRVSKPIKPHANGWLIDEQNRNRHLFQGDTRIGRGADNDIVLNDKATSREHILIREQNNNFVLYDRGSKTGTYLNNNRVERGETLMHGDTIDLGDTRFRFMTDR